MQQDRRRVASADDDEKNPSQFIIISIVLAKVWRIAFWTVLYLCFLGLFNKVMKFPIRLKADARMWQIYQEVLWVHVH